MTTSISNSSNATVTWPAAVRTHPLGCSCQRCRPAGPDADKASGPRDPAATSTAASPFPTQTSTVTLAQRYARVDDTTQAESARDDEARPDASARLESALRAAGGNADTSGGGVDLKV